MIELQSQGIKRGRSQSYAEIRRRVSLHLAKPFVFFRTLEQAEELTCTHVLKLFGFEITV
jgi:hypothetical protein